MNPSMKPLKDLNLLDDFLFAVSMENPEFCRMILEILLDKRIKTIRYHSTQKEFRNIPGGRGIWVDAYIEDEIGSVYDVEVQIKNQGNLPKRSRFYQSLIDTPLLKSGESYQELPDSYIIMISPFDLFGHGFYKYTFENLCLENPSIHLGDKAMKLFFNTNGTNDSVVSKPLADLLHYIEHTSDSNYLEATDSRIQKLHQQIQKIKADEEIGVNYMKSWELEQMHREEGKAEGIAQGIAQGITQGIEQGETRYSELIQYLLQSNRYEDLKKSANDIDYRHKLYLELPTTVPSIPQTTTKP